MSDTIVVFRFATSVAVGPGLSIVSWTHRSQSVKQLSRNIGEIFPTMVELDHTISNISNRYVSVTLNVESDFAVLCFRVILVVIVWFVVNVLSMFLIFREVFFRVIHVTRGLAFQNRLALWQIVMFNHWCLKFFRAVWNQWIHLVLFCRVFFLFSFVKYIFHFEGVLNFMSPLHIVIHLWKSCEAVIRIDNSSNFI